MKKDKQTKARLEQLRKQRKSYLDKARECVVYGDAKGYHFWISAANDVSNRIMSIHTPEGTKTVRWIEDGQLIVSYAKKAIAE